MGTQNCQILLDNSWNTYYAGQTITGQFVLNLDKEKKIRGLVIRFLGEANTSWNTTEKVRDSDGKERDETVSLSGHEEYFGNTFYLLGSKNGAEIVLPPGQHSYPFTCALPASLPSSFEGEWGHVRYTIKVTLDRPWKFDQDVKMAFTVLSPLDLNQNARLKEPMHLELEKTFCCFCCKSGPLSASIHIPASGFVPGQKIAINADVDNGSNVNVDRLKIVLRKMLEFKTNQPRRDVKKDKITIAEVAIGPVEAHSTKTELLTIEIPPLPPSNLINCSIIDLDYELKIELCVSGAHTNLDGKIPITLGTVPLTNVQSLPNAPAPVQPTAPILDPSSAPTQPVSPASPLGGWNVYPSLPPPSYAESEYRANIADKTDSEHTQWADGQSDFAPRYPVYATSALPPLPNFQK